MEKLTWMDYVNTGYAADGNEIYGDAAVENVRVVDTFPQMDFGYKLQGYNNYYNS